MTSTVRLFERPDQQVAWDRLVAAAPNGHLLQSWAWGELKAGFGWRVQRLAVGEHVDVQALPGQGHAQLDKGGGGHVDRLGVVENIITR